MHCTPNYRLISKSNIILLLRPEYSETLGWHNGCWYPGARFNIKMTSFQYGKSHCGDKTMLRPSYLYNGISYTGKTTSLYWIRAQTPLVASPLAAVITSTSWWLRCPLKSPASRLFTQSFIQAQIKENIKAPRHWPLYGDRWIPRTNGQLRGKCFHLMTSSCIDHVW